MAVTLQRPANTVPSSLGAFPFWPLAITVVFLLISLVYPFFLYDHDVGQSLSNYGIIFFGLHVGICAVALLIAVALRSTAFISVQLFHWLFFVMAPREQFIWQWDGIYTLAPLMERGLLYLIVYELLLLFTYLAGTMIRGAASDDGRAAPSTADKPSRQPAGTGWLVTVLAGIAALDLVLLALYGPILFVDRATFHERTAAIFPGPSSLVFLQFIRPALYFVPLFILRSQLAPLDGRRDRLPLALTATAIVLAGIGLLFNSPIISPRFHAGAIAVGTLMLFAGPRNTLVLLVIMLFGTTLAPVFDIFRNEWVREYGERSVGLAHFQSFDFDAFTNHFYAIYYFDVVGHFSGINLLSALLFFIPDDIWAAKIPGSGEKVVLAVGWDFRDTFPINSSMPLSAEGYLAFGLAGIVLLAVLFGVVLRLLDNAPLPKRLALAGLHPRAAVLAFTPVLLFYVTRGPLVAVYAFSLSNLLAAAFSAWLVSRPGVSVAADAAPPRLGRQRTTTLGEAARAAARTHRPAPGGAHPRTTTIAGRRANR